MLQWNEFMDKQKKIFEKNIKQNHSGNSILALVLGMFEEAWEYPWILVQFFSHRPLVIQVWQPSFLHDSST